MGVLQAGAGRTGLPRWEGGVGRWPGWKGGSQSNPIAVVGRWSPAAECPLNQDYAPQSPAAHTSTASSVDHTPKGRCIKVSATAGFQ
jgi:hypothetical protein